SEEADVSNEFEEEGNGVKTKVFKVKEKVVVSKFKKRNEEVEADVEGNESEKDRESEEDKETEVSKEKDKVSKIKKVSNKKKQIKDVKKQKHVFDSSSYDDSSSYEERFARFVVRDFSASSYEFKLEKGIIRVTPKKVHEILGVPLSGTSIFDLPEIPFDDPFVKEWFKQFDPKHLKKIRACDIAEKLVLTKTVDFMFKVNFLMLFANAMGTADTMKAIVNLIVLRRIREDTNIARIDWFIRQLPAIRNWTTTAMNRRQELKIEEQVIGKLDLHGEWTESELNQTEGFYNIFGFVFHLCLLLTKRIIYDFGRIICDFGRIICDFAESYAILVESYVILVESYSFCSMIEEKFSMISTEKIALEDLLKRGNAEFPNDEKVIEQHEKYRRLFKQSVFLEDFHGHIDDFDKNEDVGGGKNDNHGYDNVGKKKESAAKDVGKKDGVNAEKDVVNEDLFVWPQAVQPITAVETVFQACSGHDVSSVRMNMETLAQRLGIYANVIDCWVAILNHEELVKGYPSPIRHFFQPTKAIIKGTIDEEQQWKVFSDE
nr:ELM2 domain-containing protein [Tanacetum cinerariifolium]